MPPTTSKRSENKTTDNTIIFTFGFLNVFSIHRRTGRGAGRLGTQIFWAAREIWAKPVFQDVFLFLPEVGIVKPVKFTRDSGYLARDEHLVIMRFWSESPAR